MKGVFLIGFAIFIDALQAMFALIFTALEAVTPIGGAFGAAAACTVFSSGIVSKITHGIECFFFGAGVSAFAVPIGAAVDVVISVTFGGALIAALVFTGYFSLGAVMGGSILEMLPLFDALIPGWTLMAWRCVHTKNKEEKEKKRAQAVEITEQPRSTMAFDGIKPAETYA